jgi:putative transposase
MPRIARVVVPGMPHHVTHRGIRRSDVFWDDADRLYYLELLRMACRTFLLRVWAYCLMTNHVHLVAVPERLDSIGKVFHWAHGKYDSYFNEKYALTGNLWERRPHSAVLDDRHAMASVRYVERNPVRAGMVPRASDYRWSSARVRCGLAYDSLLDPSWPPAGLIADWQTWLAGDDDTTQEDQIRRSTSTGRPCGDESFIADIESRTRRCLRPKPPGRPRKTPATGSGRLWTEDGEEN